MANRLFLDCGSNIGQSVQAFQSWKKEDASQYDVICFEANIEFIPPLMSRIAIYQSKFKSINLLVLAVDDHWGTTNFDGWQLSEFGTDNAKKRRVVPCMDFPDWFANSTDNYEEIILKLDIEGAEYKVLEKMHRLNCLSKITQLFVEFHGFKRNFSSQDTQRMISLVYKNGLSPYMWECSVQGELMHDPTHTMARIIPGTKDMIGATKFIDHYYVVEPTTPA